MRKVVRPRCDAAVTMPLTIIDPRSPRFIVLTPQPPWIQAVTTLRVTVRRPLAPQDWKSELPGGQRYLTTYIQQPSADVTQTRAKSGIRSPGSPPFVLSPLTHQTDHTGREQDCWWPTIISPTSRLSKCHFQAVCVTPQDNRVTEKKSPVSFLLCFTYHLEWGITVNTKA